MLLCQGKSVADFFVTALGAKPEQCIVTPNLVDVDFWQGADNDAARSGILFAGWIDEAKGIFDLIEAVAGSPVLRQQNVWICGGGQDSDRAREKLEAAGEHGMKLMGWVDDVHLRDLMSRCRIFVLPSYSEGFPVSIVEAMAAGAAVVATAVGVIADFLADGQNAMLVCPGDVAGLTLALERVTTEEKLRSQITTQARQLVATTFDMRRASGPLGAVFKRLTTGDCQGSEDAVSAP
jgi:glycosyltransferase involved in cell wall biosynthesis